MNSIYCCDKYGVIGNEQTNDLVFRIKADMQRFKQLTANNGDKKSVLIVGHNTFKSLNNNLFKDRQLWVLSRTKYEHINEDNVYYFSSYDDIINTYTMNKDKYIFWVIGGSQIYKLFESVTDKIYETIVLADRTGEHAIKYIRPHYFKVVNTSEIYTDYDMITNEEVMYYYNELIVDHSEMNHINTNIIMNNNEGQYLNVLRKTLGQCVRPSRNANTYSYFGEQIKFDLRKSFPLLTTKKMAIKSIVHELLFFIRGSTDTKELESVGVNIWKGNTSREFLDENGFKDRAVGEMGPMYGNIWRHFNGQLDQFEKLFHEIKTKPNSRRLLLTTYNPLQADEGVLYPCHSLIIQFYIEEIDQNSKYLSLQMYQRSADVFLGLPFNIASMALFLHIVCNFLTDDANVYVPKEVIISLGDVHLYECHRNQAMEQLRRIPLKGCQLRILNKYDKIEDYKYEDFIFEQYKSYPMIKADMVA
jgi:thymidylate synthase